MVTMVLSRTGRGQSSLVKLESRAACSAFFSIRRSSQCKSLDRERSGLILSMSELSPKVIEPLGDSTQHLLDPFLADTEPFSTTRALQIPMAPMLATVLRFW